MQRKIYENKNLEFKIKYSDSILKTISAFSNYDGGKILIGVDDDGNYIGVENFKEEKLKIENKINDSIEPRPNYEINLVKKENKYIIEIVVYPDDNTPYLYQGKAYQRKDTSTIPVDQIGLINLSLKGKNLSYDQLPSSDANFKFNILEDYFNKVKDEKIGKAVLKTLGLINNSNDYTKAAELLSDENYNLASGIDIVKFGKSTSEFVDRKIVDKVSLLKQYEEGLFMFKKHYPEIEVVEGFNRVKKASIPYEAFREALANAIVHRDYLINSHVKVSMFDNRIEIVSPGGLPAGIDEHNYLNSHLSIPRNIIIAQVFFVLEIIEKFGTGIRRIKKAYEQYHLKPKYQIDKNFIKVVLPNLLFDDSDMIPEKRIMNFLEMQLEITRQDVEKILNVNKSKALELLNNLVDKGLIRSNGSGRSSSYVSNV
jgi:ATP-dependent DNA helicase RecG